MQRYAVQKSFIQHKDRVDRQWFEVDASKETLGRMATHIARLLMGKHKPTYTPHVDCGDFVVVTNAAKVNVTGRKVQRKLYHFHTGFMGGLYAHNLEWMLENKPEDVIRLAVKRMLPKSKLARHMLSKLKVYGGSEHEHQAQQPQPLSFGTMG